MLPPSAPPATPGAPAADPTFDNFIEGAWVASVTGRTFASLNPADTRDEIGRFAASGPADVAAAVRAAGQAFPVWRRTPAPKRGEVLDRFGALLAEHKERLAGAMTREMGIAAITMSNKEEKGHKLAREILSAWRHMIRWIFS